MGGLFGKSCCNDRETLLTCENLTSRACSPVDYEFQRIIIEIPENGTKMLGQVDECLTPDSKPKMLRRTISRTFENQPEAKFSRCIKRSQTLKVDKVKENFLRKAKKKLSLIRFDNYETPRYTAGVNWYRGRVLYFEDWHISIPGGDKECDVD